MMYHAAVWLDQHQAHVFKFVDGEVDEKVIHEPHHPNRVHHRGPNGPRANGDTQYLDEITRSLTEAREVLIVGPGVGKLELMRHLHNRAPAVAERVVGVETVDHPTHNQLIAYAKDYFRKKDRML